MFFKVNDVFSAETKTQTTEGSLVFSPPTNISMRPKSLMDAPCLFERGR